MLAPFRGLDPDRCHRDCDIWDCRGGSGLWQTAKGWPQRNWWIVTIGIINENTQFDEFRQTMWITAIRVKKSAECVVQRGRQAKIAIPFDVEKDIPSIGDGVMDGRAKLEWHETSKAM
ncbi:hypothetical protein [Sphingobium sp. YR768]|uniref:hypothetical protein n=1 Tax=Sphingobium sp. YR768 TaxID=1884365 RepID=UPI0015A716DB|nr:hypothetical protein [Sphingobium sp. YR768]